MLMFMFFFHVNAFFAKQREMERVYEFISSLLDSYGKSFIIFFVHCGLCEIRAIVSSLSVFACGLKGYIMYVKKGPCEIDFLD